MFITAQRLPAVNRGLAAKHLEPVRVVSEADWQTRNAGEGGPPPAQSERRID